MAVQIDERPRHTRQRPLAATAGGAGRVPALSASRVVVVARNAAGLRTLVGLEEILEPELPTLSNAPERGARGWPVLIRSALCSP